MQLRVPGPTPCPPQVLKSMGKQMVDHRGKEFQELIKSITAKLQTIFQTKNDVLILTGAGTGGMEAAIVNMLSPGDKILSASNGVFGNRFADIAQTFGADVTRLKFEMGKPIDPEGVRQALKADPKIKAVLITHNETSTGVTSDLAAVSAVIKEFDKLAIVDAISGLSSIDLQADNWKCDVVVSGSQKGWMVPPGLSMVSVSERAWKAHAEAKMPRFYWDFTRAKNFLEKGQTPWTPAIPIFYALGVSLDMILAEGLSNVFARHAKVAKKARDGAKSMGLAILPSDEKYASNTVTAVKADGKLDVSKLRQILRDEYKVVIAGGQGDLTGKIFRIGHLGWVTEKDMEEVLVAIKKALPKASS
jgi:aspartate aminotransferase-like enzyme